MTLPESDSPASGQVTEERQNTPEFAVAPIEGWRLVVVIFL
jgi:hypothetical protein